MKFFNLPDLGEGIPEADIIEWHIKEGDSVTEDQIIVSVETAKAIVDVPSPISGVVAKLYGKPGDTIMTGAPLLEFVSDQEDAGTVVGELATASHDDSADEHFFIGTPPDSGKAPAAESGGDVTALAAKMGVSIDPKSVGKNSIRHSYPLANPEPLKGVRKHMARTMAHSHAEVVPVTLFDDVDIEHWPKGTDITVRLIQAITAACKEEPALNTWFDETLMSREVFTSVHLGLAVDSEEGLFVPVIRDAEKQDATSLRDRINHFRKAVEERSLPPSEMQGATITLSNFGVFAGQFATPVVVPPMVCIIGIGRLRARVVSEDGQIQNHRILPISLTFDHRAVTGGEATRFLHCMLQKLSE
ncbi:dihydrolipoamide acetyltransferase family protein [Endozoicomonas sp. 8E]|uniref:dihydrolipoamide acetyltransferase family protein n=1 Tax=Endozoicomonas sp. 8E TaxID=3035692 RepID=UPI002938FFC2|nr:dihydrolipoamide acetyltransferase family protein [Endozoicomonas sp. 8E]WOG27807.1 dihydrolipoamide acetyltransferase family protein [Endozoicomonas sp. 8E]